MKVGILFGPASGEGAPISAERLLARRLEGRSVAVCGGLFAGSGKQAGWTILGAAPASGYLESLRGAVAALEAWGAELLVCVGGDGLASYAADAMLNGPRPMALLGIAAGTINVGPIVTLDIDRIPSLDLERLAFGKVSAVQVLVDGKHLAYGFNDVVIGDTFLGTSDGGIASLSVRALLERGEKLKRAPSPDIAGPAFSVKKNGAAIQAGMVAPAQVIVSPLGSREFYARAVTGILCNAAYMKGAAALALFDSVIVSAGSPARGFSNFSASEQLLFGPEDTVELSGLGPAGQIVVDGNPFIRSGEIVQFISKIDLVSIARMPGCVREDGYECRQA
ncbi:MAG: diacylglycerol kinase family protein [Spirochaetales bacterium]|jgi:hypothetical protein